MPQIKLVLEKDIFNELQDISEELGKDKNEIIKKALEYYFDYLDIEIAEKRLKDLEEGKSYLVSADEVFKEIESL